MILWFSSHLPSCYSFCPTQHTDIVGMEDKVCPMVQGLEHRAMLDSCSPPQEHPDEDGFLKEKAGSSGGVSQQRELLSPLGLELSSPAWSPAKAVRGIGKAFAFLWNALPSYSSPGPALLYCGTSYLGQWLLKNNLMDNRWRHVVTHTGLPSNSHSIFRIKGCLEACTSRTGECKLFKSS